MTSRTFSTNVVVNREPWVLLIEDDKDMRDALFESLDGKGFKVIAVGDFSKAINKIQNQKFACIILDIHLSSDNKNGEDILKSIRDSFLCDINKETPVILCSGNIEPKLIQKYKDRISDALAKPFGLDDLEKKIRRCIEISANRSNNKVS